MFCGLLGHQSRFLTYYLCLIRLLANCSHGGLLHRAAWPRQMIPASVLEDMGGKAANRAPSWAWGCQELLSAVVLWCPHNIPAVSLLWGCGNKRAPSEGLGVPQHPDAGMYGWTDMQECSCANDRGDVGLWGSVMNKILISP